MTVVRWILAIALFVVLLVAGWSFGHGNPQAVPIDYLFGTTEPLAVWKIVVGAWLGGMATAGLYLGLALAKNWAEIRRLRRELRRLENELADFRNKPLDADLARIAMDDPSETVPAAAANGAGRGR